MELLPRLDHAWIDQSHLLLWNLFVLGCIIAFVRHTIFRR